MQAGVRLFDAFLLQFAEAIERPLRQSTWLSSVDITAVNHLQAHDAVHLATARELGLADFATSDDHFARIGDPSVWLIRDARALQHPTGQ